MGWRSNDIVDSHVKFECTSLTIFQAGAQLRHAIAAVRAQGRMETNRRQARRPPAQGGGGKLPKSSRNLPGLNTGPGPYRTAPVPVAP